MRLGLTSLVLLCSFIWVCVGAPPREDGRSNIWGTRYKKEEDQFIIDELSNMLDDTVPIYNRAVWETLAKKYREKYEQGCPGFRGERSAQSLLGRFKSVLIHNDPSKEVQIPQDLMQKIMRHRYLQKTQRGSRSPWTKEENEFIIEELSKPTYTNLFSSSTFEAIRAEHDKKREAATHGFEDVRTKESIRQHLYAMSRNGQIPNEVLETLETREKGNKQPYNKHENDFIIEELSKPSCPSLFSTATFEAIRTGHEKKRKAEVHGFKHHRTPGSIRRHLSFMKDNGLLPTELLEKLGQQGKEQSQTPSAYTVPSRCPEPKAITIRYRTCSFVSDKKLSNVLGASSSSSTTLNQGSDFHDTNERQDDDWIAEMIEELENKDFEIDLSKLDSMDDE